MHRNGVSEVFGRDGKKPLKIRAVEKSITIKAIFNANLILIYHGEPYHK